mmetsp:Transcript_39377/g.114020  ORF Transcript_39377/g.114020 Transcript_39377/m.114020 type:complete len:226 (+) Transcript_39377:104-781(+)
MSSTAFWALAAACCAPFSAHSVMACATVYSKRFWMPWSSASTVLSVRCAPFSKAAARFFSAPSTARSAREAQLFAAWSTKRWICWWRPLSRASTDFSVRKAVSNVVFCVPWIAAWPLTSSSRRPCTVDSNSCWLLDEDAWRLSTLLRSFAADDCASLLMWVAADCMAASLLSLLFCTCVDSSSKPLAVLPRLAITSSNLCLSSAFCSSLRLTIQVSSSSRRVRQA